MQKTNNCFLQKVLTAIITIIRKGLKILGAGGQCSLKDVPCKERCIQQPDVDYDALLYEFVRWFAERLHLEKAPTATTNS